MFDRLPDEKKLTIFGFFPKKTKIQLQLVSVEWLNLLRDYSLWLETGAENYNNFMLRIRLLSIGLKNLIWNGIYTLTLAEDVKRICSFNVAQRQSELVSPEKAALMPDFPQVFYLDSLLSDYGIMALKEILITPEQASTIVKWKYLNALLSWHGLQALREKHISVDQVNQFRTARHLEVVLSKKGLQALREGLITVDDAIIQPTPLHIEYLIGTEGSNAIRFNLITAKEAANFKLSSLKKHVIRILDKHEKENLTMNCIFK